MALLGEGTSGVKPTNPDLIFYTNNLGSQLWVYNPRSTPSWFNAATGQFASQKPSGLSTFNLRGPITQDQSNLFPYLGKYVTGVPAPTRAGATTYGPSPTSSVYGPSPPTGYKPSSYTQPSTAGPKVGDTRQSQIPGYWEQWDGFKWVLVPVETPSAGGGGFAPTPYAQTQAGILAEQQFQAAEAEKNRVAAAAEAERNRVEQLRQSRFSALQTIVDRFIAEQGTASRLVAGLGPDQFKMAAALQGLPVLGTTPQAGFARAQTEFASRPVPNVSAEAPISDIEAAISAIGGIKPPTLPTSGFGMALGGTLPGMVPEAMQLPPMAAPEAMPQQPSGMLPGQEMMIPEGMMPPTGPPAAPGAPQFGTTKTAVLIGEGNLQVEPGTEVAITDTATGITEIIPLTGQAQGGASIFSPGFGGFNAPQPGSLFNPESAGAAINQLYAGMGLSSFPMARNNPNINMLNRLGVQPSLASEWATPGGTGVYWRDPTTNQYRRVADPGVFNRSGFNWGDVQSLTQGDISGLPMGPMLTSPPVARPTSFSAFQKLGMPLVEKLTGAILPSPAAAAGALARLSAQSPGLFELALQAYESTGLMTRQQVLGTITNALITGRDQGTGIGLR